MKTTSARFLAFILLALGPVTGLAPLGLAPLLHLAGLGCLITYRLDNRAWPFIKNKITLALALLILFAFASCLWASAGRMAWVKFPELLAPALSACIVPQAVKTLPASDKVRLQTYFFIGLCIGLVAFFGDLALGRPFMSWHKQLSQAPLNTFNRSDIGLGLLLWPAAALLYARGYKAVSVALLLAYTAAIFFLLSHSAMVAMIFGLVTLLVAFFVSSLAGGVLIAFCAVGFLFSIPVAFLLYRHGLSTDMSLPLSFRHRVEIWNFTAGRIALHPLFGLGLEGSRAIPISDLPPGFMPISQDKPPLHPHNVFLQLWLEFGAVGSVPAFAFMASLINSAKHLPLPLRCFALATIAASLSVASFAFGIWQGWWLALLIFLPVLLMLSEQSTSKPDG